MSPKITNAVTISGKSLPFELIEIILSHLPVKSLKRFRAVEKSWLSLIDSKEFARSHLRRSLQTRSNRNLVCGRYGFNSIDLDTLNNKPRSLPQLFTYEKKDLLAVSNSVNGLVVVKRGPEPLALWNPFTREYKFLPYCPTTFSASVNQSVSCKITYGFGYDSKNDDYKVVKVLLYAEPFSFMLPSEEWIYGLKSDCWRRIKTSSYNKGQWPPHLNGVLHTMIYFERVNQYKLMGFSVETEEDYEVPMPGIESHGLVACFLDVFDGCLTVVCNYGCRIVIWVMEEYGVKESWKPLQSFAVDPHSVVRPLVYSKDRDKILLIDTCKGIKVFCLRTQIVIHFTMPFAFGPGVCVETLISPHGWDKGKGDEKGSTEKQNKDGETNKGKKEMKTKKKRDDFLSSGFKLVL